MNLYEVLQKPLISEKSTKINESERKYSFLIHRDAGKKDVKAALKKIYDVDVVSVRTLIGRKRARRRGMYWGRRVPHYKKAIVQLAEGQTLKFLEQE